MEARGVAMRRADVIEPTEASPLFLFGGIQKQEAAGAAGAIKLVSRIKDSPALVRIASQLEGQVQNSINRLVAKLGEGNLNPGIGSRFLFNGIFEARARDGARVYFRNTGERTIEILGKSTKATQDQVISVLETMYK
jgi:putative component of toxin-antitoxin plasmid stabilization module